MKAVATAIKAFISVMLQVRKDRLLPPGAKRRENIVKDLDIGLARAIQQSKEWLLRVIRQPVMQILTDN